MSKRMAMLVLFVIALVVGLILYQRHRTYNHFNGGEVTAAQAHEPAVSTTVEPPPTRAGMKPPAGQPLDDTSVSDTATTTPLTSSDSPTDRATFRGTGRFQVYRQGDLTWRLDTDSGDTCVLFATDEEWRNPRVFNRACADD